MLAALCGAGILFLGCIVATQPASELKTALTGCNDFAQLYAGATLAGTEGLYRPDANKALQRELTGRYAESVLYSRLPFYAFLLKPLTALPYQTAYILFQAISIASLISFVWLLAPKSTELPVLASYSLPVLVSLRLGQDIMLVALAYVVFFVLSERGRGFHAGLALSLCLIKFHFFPLTALALILRREWSVVRGAAAGSAALLLLSFGAGGIGWPSAYWSLIRNPVLHPSVRLMPNAHGATISLFGPNPIVETILCLAIAGAFTALVLRNAERPLVYSMALAAGLLISYHAYIQDAVLLLPAAGILGYSSRALLVKILITVSALPLAWAFALLDSPLNEVFPAVLALTLAVALLETRKRPEQIDSRRSAILRAHLPSSE